MYGVGRVGSIGRIGAAERRTNPVRAMLNLLKNDVGANLMYDFRLTDNMFQDVNGGLPVIANNDPVGIYLDRKKFGGKTFSQYMTDQPEIALNGALTNGANWITRGLSTLTDGVARIYSTDTTYSAIEQSNIAAIKPNTFYLVSFDLVAFVTGQIAVDLYGAPTAPVSDTSLGRKSLIIKTIGTPNNTFAIKRNNVATDYSVDNISLKEIPAEVARQTTAAARPQWVNNAKPFLLFDGVDDQFDTDLIPGATGTMVAAFRPFSTAINRFAIAGGTSAGDKRARLGLQADGRASFTLNNAYRVIEGSIIDQDVILIQTWGSGRRRCYHSLYSNPKVVDEVLVPNTDGTGNTYKIGSLETGGERLVGRFYGSLLRNVETSDEDVRNILLPAFKGLF